ncbi:MAG: FtsW/RodA/SpoVE family cell cycle protein [Atopobiaceae bacterium]|jgi:cell division protein FtsW
MKTTGQMSERGIFGVPARIMMPRIILFVCTFVLVIFGLLMIFSASSITALHDYGDAAYYLNKQLAACIAGLVALLALMFIDYRIWTRWLLALVWLGTMALLVLVYFSSYGQDAYGATRWISIAGFNLQPSEFSKVTMVLVGSELLVQFFEERSYTSARFAAHALIAIGLPVVLIGLQPDKGTVGIIGITLLIMSYLAGAPNLIVGGLFGVAIVGGLAAGFADPYSRARIETMINPFLDPYGAGWQLRQGFYAFGTGGLFGVGLGMSRQKYSYLPFAHNDFIFAVVGEELGFIGVLAVIAVFALLVWAGFKIAQQAPDLRGKLIASGCSILFGVQFMLNVLGVIGFFPLSGKPVPFISYGGSSIISSLMLIGLLGSVSLRSTLPKTVYERRRDRLHLAGDGVDLNVGQSAASGRPGSPRRNVNLSGPSSRQVSSFSSSSSTSSRRGSWTRIDLDYDPADRLRLHDDTARTRGSEGLSHVGRARRNRRSERVREP